MKTTIRISEAEWDVMEVVWSRAPVAASAVTEDLEPKHSWTLTTVRTLLRRLVTKGALAQKPEGKRYLYTPRISRAECTRRESQSFLDRVLGRSPISALLHLVEQTPLSKQDIQELRRILREKEGKS